MFKNEAAVCTNFHQTSHFGIIGVVVVGVGGGNWIAEALRVTSHSGQIMLCMVVTTYNLQRLQLHLNLIILYSD